MTKTKTEKLIQVFESADGVQVSAEKLMKRSGLKNLSSTINRLRNQGLTIYTNKRYNKSEGVQYFYRAPSNQF